MSEQAPTYTTEEGTVGYVILDISPDQDNDLYATLAEAIEGIEVNKRAATAAGGTAEGLRVFEVMGIDREAELDMASDLALRHGHALISDETMQELGPTLAAAEEEVAANE